MAPMPVADRNKANWYNVVIVVSSITLFIGLMMLLGSPIRVCCDEESGYTCLKGECEGVNGHQYECTCEDYCADMNCYDGYDGGSLAMGTVLSLGGLTALLISTLNHPRGTCACCDGCCGGNYTPRPQPVPGQPSQRQGGAMAGTSAGGGATAEPTIVYVTQAQADAMGITDGTVTSAPPAYGVQGIQGAASRPKQVDTASMEEEMYGVGAPSAPPNDDESSSDDEFNQSMYPAARGGGTALI